MITPGPVGASVAEEMIISGPVGASVAEEMITPGPVGASVAEDVEVFPPIMKIESYLILNIIL